MPSPIKQIEPPGTYNPRWFIWTIVFLVVTGVALVSYIVLSDTSNAYGGDFPVHRAALKK